MTCVNVDKSQCCHERVIIILIFEIITIAVFYLGLRRAYIILGVDGLFYCLAPQTKTYIVPPPIIDLLIKKNKKTPYSIVFLSKHFHPISERFCYGSHRIKITDREYFVRIENDAASELIFRSK